ANPKTFAMLSNFIPVPVEEIKRDFEAKVHPDEICARSVHALLQRGVKNIYISNLPMSTATQTFSRVESRVEEMLVVSLKIRRGADRPENQGVVPTNFPGGGPDAKKMWHNNILEVIGNTPIV